MRGPRGFVPSELSYATRGEQERVGTGLRVTPAYMGSKECGGDAGTDGDPGGGRLGGLARGNEEESARDRLIGSGRDTGLMKARDPRNRPIRDGQNTSSAEQSQKRDGHYGCSHALPPARLNLSPTAGQ